MIGPINTSISTKLVNNSIDKKSQQETEYKQPKVSESQNYQNQLIEISDDMSMVATLFLSDLANHWIKKQIEDKVHYILQKKALIKNLIKL